VILHSFLGGVSPLVRQITISKTVTYLKTTTYFLKNFPRTSQEKK